MKSDFIRSQNTIANDEIRYTIMRALRCVFGWPLFLIGFLGFIFGVLGMFIGTGYPFLSYVLLTVVGLVTFASSLSMLEPYSFSTSMDRGSGRVKCLKCETPMENLGVFATCSHCGSWFPVFFKVRVFRMIGSLVTTVNIILTIIGFTIAIVR